MLAWINSNLINIILILAVVLTVFLIVRGMIRDRKAGRSSCGGNCASCGCACAGCPMSGACHGRNAEVKKA